MKMMHFNKTTCGLLAAALPFLAGCEGGVKGDPDNRGDFKVSLVSTGQGQIYPYRVQQLVGGVPTSTILNIESEDTLHSNVASGNAVLPVAVFPTTAILPDGSAGNHYLWVRFTHKLKMESILSDLLANATTNSGLTTTISLIAYDPSNENTTVLKGKGFVGGYTYFNNAGVLEKTQAVSADDEGNVTILDARANGFPTGFSGDEQLVDEKSFVFVADTNSDLTDFETFDPGNTNLLIRIIVSNGVRNNNDKVLEQEVSSATTVGADPNPADVLGWHSSKTLEITPGNDSTGVDPTSTVLVRFNKPVQPADVGTFFAKGNLTPATGGIGINVTASATTFPVSYYADPVSYGDLTNYIITPLYTLPGTSVIDVTVNQTSIHGLTGPILGNQIATQFTTGRGPGIVNAPVAPDAIYVGIGGPTPGIKVIDLNGYGQGTRGPNVDPATTKFAQNPNLGKPGVSPSLSIGGSGLDAGSAGRLELVEDTNGNTLLLGSPVIGEVGDIHLGAPLDLVFNNGNINVNASGANQVNLGTLLVQPGNGIAVSPHPNPPRLVFPPPNVSKMIFGEEPTTTSSQGPGGTVQTTVPPCQLSAVNQLNAGSVLDYPQHIMEGVFFGPQPAPASPPPPPPFCPFTSRQQIGHFLYVLDRDNRKILVLNSNRFTVLDSINLSDPFSMTMSPTLGMMAVTNERSGSVSFINTDPSSAKFNQVVAETRVDDGPTAIAWQPDGDAVLVLSTDSNTLTVIAAGDFSVQKVVSGNLNGPFELAVTPRYVTSGNLSGIFYAYILNRDGTVAVYESGPDGVNGIGFNDIIGTVEHSFRRPKSIKYDYGDIGLGSFYVAHVDENGLGQVSHVLLSASPTGQFPTNQISGTGLVLPPTFRQKVWSVDQTFGGDRVGQATDLLSGSSPVDIVTDEILNNGFSVNQITSFNQSTGKSILGHSSKAAIYSGAGTVSPPILPKWLFIALADTGKVDVFDLSSKTKVRTIDVPGVRTLSGYWRQ